MGKQTKTFEETELEKGGVDVTELASSAFEDLQKIDEVMALRIEQTLKKKRSSENGGGIDIEDLLKDEEVESFSDLFAAVEKVFGPYQYPYPRMRRGPYPYPHPGYPYPKPRKQEEEEEEEEKPPKPKQKPPKEEEEEKPPKPKQKPPKEEEEDEEMKAKREAARAALKSLEDMLGKASLTAEQKKVIQEKIRTLKPLVQKAEEAQEQEKALEAPVTKGEMLTALRDFGAGIMREVKEAVKDAQAARPS